MSMHDARNIVLTRKEVESKLDKSHICLMPQDDGSIRVWVAKFCPDLCLHCLGQGPMHGLTALHQYILSR